MQLVLQQQGAQLFDDGLQLVLVAQPPAAEKLHVHPRGCADEPQLLGANPGADVKVPTADEERIQGAVRFVKLRAICKVVADYQHLIQLLHLQLLGCLGDLALPLDDVPQRRLVPLIVVGPLPFGIHLQVLLYVLLDGDPAVVDVHAGTEDVDFLKDSAVLLQNHADQRHGFAGLAGAEEDTCTWYLGHHRVRGLFAGILCRRKQLDLPHFLCLLAKPSAAGGAFILLASGGLCRGGRWRLWGLNNSQLHSCLYSGAFIRVAACRGV